MQDSKDAIGFERTSRETLAEGYLYGHYADTVANTPSFLPSPLSRRPWVPRKFEKISGETKESVQFSFSSRVQ